MVFVSMTSVSSPAKLIGTAKAIIADGAIETRLIFEYGLPTPDFAAFVHLFTEDGRRALKDIYRGYMDVAAESGLPMQVGTPTWRAHPEGLARQGFAAAGDVRRVNAEAFELLASIRRDLALENQVAIAGVVGPRYDGYSADNAPSADEAEAYDAAQVSALAAAGVDLLYAPTFASAQELLGVARAFAKTGLPYVLAPVVDGTAHLPDGTALDSAVALADQVTPPPTHFLIGCAHPSLFGEATDSTAWARNNRVQGLKANASPLPPSALDGLDHVEADSPETFAAAMIDLHRQGYRVLGGCCGTSEAHIRAIARGLKTVL